MNQKSDNNVVTTWSKVLVAAGLVLLAGGLIKLLCEDEYRAKATFKSPVGHMDWITVGYGDLPDSWLGFDGSRHRNWGKIMRASVKSSRVLSNITTDLKLDVRWARRRDKGEKLTLPQVMRRLDYKTEVTWRGDNDLRDDSFTSNNPKTWGVYTDLTDVSFTSTDPVEAAEIANAICETHLKILTEKNARELLAGVKALEKQLKIEDKNIVEEKETLDRLRIELKIPESELASESLITNFPTFAIAQSNLLEKLKLQQLIARRLASVPEDADLRARLPCHRSDVGIIDAAIVPTRPFRRHRLIGLGISAIGVICVGIGVAHHRQRRRL